MRNHSEKSFIMAERLKQLREKEGYSHEKLSNALNERYGIKISSDSLMNYEVSDPHHTKAGKNQGMRVEYLRCLADFYGVSSDYLLGVRETKTPDVNALNAMEFTGLSEDTVLLLNAINKIEFGIEAMNTPSSEIVSLFFDRISCAQNLKLLRFELYRLIEALIEIITEDPLLFGPAFQNYIWGTFNTEKCGEIRKQYTPSDEIVSELNENGYQVIKSNAYADWQLNLVFDELKHRVRYMVRKHVKNRLQ